jgi:hypothetical protein
MRQVFTVSTFGNALVESERLTGAKMVKIVENRAQLSQSD